MLLLVGGVWLARLVARDRYWRENATQLWRRRPLALITLALFLLIGVLDSVGWVGGGASGEDDVAALRSRTLIDRLFQPERFTEASYSAPLATLSFYGGQPLKHPGKHLLGTDILGRDVVYRAFKGVRVALLIGGLHQPDRHSHRPPVRRLCRLLRQAH
jgi:ABC-type dipeptide/oligopeptide/nickel transport system permease subunit